MGFKDPRQVLEEAVQAYRDGLNAISRDSVPVLWAMTHYHLGNALWRLAEGERDTARLEQAAAAFREAANAHSGDRMPLVAEAHDALGRVEALLAERRNGS